MKQVFKRTSIVLLVFVLPAAALFPDISVVGELTREKVAGPGERYEGRIEILNSGQNEEEVKVYQSDYLYFADGRNEYGEPGRVPRSNSKWIEFSPRQFVLPAGEKGIVNYIVRVPKSDTLSGTYWSMLMVEPVRKLDPRTFTQGQFGIYTVFRYGIQMVTNINDTGIKSLKYSNIKLEKDSLNYMVQFDLENNGERRLKATLWVELWDTNGKYVGKFSGNEARPFPGTSSRQEIHLPNVRPGTYKALLVADCGGEDVFGLNLNIDTGP